MSSLPQQKTDHTERMAIPGDSENPVAQMAMEDSASTSEGHDAVYGSVRAKGSGKEIIINSGGLGSDVQEHERVSGGEESKIGFSRPLNSQSDLKLDVRATRKRSHSPYPKTVVTEVDNLLHNVASSDSNICRPQGKQKVSFKKRKLPHTPLEKQYEKPIDCMTQSLVLKIILENGVNINGKKFSLRLIPEEENLKADESHLKRHGFSPGNYEVNQMKTVVDGSYEEYMEKDEQTSPAPLETISEDFVDSSEQLPLFSQDGSQPLDLSMKGLTEHRCEPVDYSIGHAQDISLTSVRMNSDREAASPDSLPSLTLKTETLNLGNKNIPMRTDEHQQPADEDKPKGRVPVDPAVMAYIQAPQQRWSGDCPPVFVPDSRELNAVPIVSPISMPRDQASSSVNQSPPIQNPLLPNFANLEVTNEEGKILLTKSDDTKEKLRIKILSN